MRIYQSNDYLGMSRTAASILSAQVILKPDCVLGLATGFTPIGTYKQIISWFNKGDLSFAQVKSINLDEYVGLPQSHPQSYRYFMQTNFFDHININLENTYLPDGMADDILDECEKYNATITELGGIDIQLLGIGHNGHVGFNEPGAAFELGAHQVQLAQSTIDANARFFDNDNSKVPKSAITLGIRNIMHSKKVLIAVSGENKADIILKAFKGPVTPQVPASILQLHPDVTVVGDKAALYKLIESGEKVCE